MPDVPYTLYFITGPALFASLIVWGMSSFLQLGGCVQGSVEVEAEVAAKCTHVVCACCVLVDEASPGCNARVRVVFQWLVWVCWCQRSSKTTGLLQLSCAAAHTPNSQPYMFISQCMVFPPCCSAAPHTSWWVITFVPCTLQRAESTSCGVAVCSATV